MALKNAKQAIQGKDFEAALAFCQVRFYQNFVAGRCKIIRFFCSACRIVVYSLTVTLICKLRF